MMAFGKKKTCKQAGISEQMNISGMEYIKSYKISSLNKSTRKRRLNFIELRLSINIQL
jgi:hypothetical protein